MGGKACAYGHMVAKRPSVNYTGGGRREMAMVRVMVDGDVG